MKRILTKEKVGGSFVIDSIQRVEDSKSFKKFIVTCNKWTEPHIVTVAKESVEFPNKYYDLGGKSGYFIKDLTMGRMHHITNNWKGMKTLKDFFDEIDITEDLFENGYGKKI